MLNKLILITALFFQVGAHAKSIPPPPKNYVYDEAGLLTNSINALSSQLAQEDRQFGNQILVAVFNSLEQEDLVDYTNRVFAAWQPGEKAKSNGALLAIYLKEKKMRIEVGYGLEPLLTDAKSKGIMIDILKPAFAQAQYAEGIVGATSEIQRIIHSDGTEQIAKKNPQNRRQSRPIFFVFFIILVILISLFDRISSFFGLNTLGSGRGGNGWSGGGFGGYGGGGGWGGGSGGGGGFSGGGGSSGGGGASGDW